MNVMQGISFNESQNWELWILGVGMHASEPLQISVDHQSNEITFVRFPFNDQSTRITFFDTDQGKIRGKFSSPPTSQGNRRFEGEIEFKVARKGKEFIGIPKGFAMIEEWYFCLQEESTTSTPKKKSLFNIFKKVFPAKPSKSPQEEVLSIGSFSPFLFRETQQNKKASSK